VFLDRLPDDAQQTIAQRYEEQFELLRQLSDSIPLDPCSELDPSQVMNQLGAIREWQELVRSRGQQLADPVILGAEIVGACGDRNSSYTVKEFEHKGLWWTPSVSAPPEEWPSVSLWYAGMTRVVRYEDRVSSSPDEEKRFRIDLDLDGLALE